MGWVSVCGIITGVSGVVDITSLGIIRMCMSSIGSFSSSSSMTIVVSQILMVVVGFDFRREAVAHFHGQATAELSCEGKG